MRVGLKIWRFNALTGERAREDVSLRRRPARRQRPYDYPKRDDENFMKHSVTRWSDGRPELPYDEVRYTKYDPMERKY